MIGRITWHAGRIMGRIHAHATGRAEEPTRARVAAVTTGAALAWVALCGLAWFTARWLGR